VKGESIMEAERIGMTRLFVDIQISMELMKDWTPERIASFFEGLAKVQAAANPNNWDERGVKGGEGS
jgi:hypothetical protein